MAWACLCLCASGRAADVDAAPGGQVIRPTLDMLLTYSDVTRPGLDTSRDVVTQFRPGFQFTTRSGRVRGSLNYSLNAINHSQPSGSELQNTLNAAFTAEAIENFAFVDANATVAQSAVSAYGQQSVPGSVLDNSNRAEVASINLVPYVRGAFGSLATYELRLNAAATNARHSKEGDSTTAGAAFSVNGSRGGLLGWGFQASHQHSAYRLGRATDSDRATVSVSARPDPEVQIALRGGTEASDVLDAERRQVGTYGGSVTWTPNERTVALFDTEHRYFGQSRRISLEHRFPRTSLRFSSTRDVTTTSDPRGVGQPQSLYQLLDAQFRAQFPDDPVARDQAVRDRLAQLGVTDPGTLVPGGFLTGSTSLQTRSDLGWTFTGVRLTLGLQAFASQTTALDSGGPVAGGEIRQRGYTTNASYRLTPTATANLSGSRLMTKGTPTQPGTDLKSLNLSWTDQLSRYATASLGARYTVFNSTSTPYREAAVTASLSLRY